MKPGPSLGAREEHCKDLGGKGWGTPLSESKRGRDAGRGGGEGSPQILRGASSSRRMGWLKKISRDLRHRPRISFSVSCTFFPGREPCTGGGTGHQDSGPTGRRKVGDTSGPVGTSEGTWVSWAPPCPGAAVAAEPPRMGPLEGSAVRRGGLPPNSPTHSARSLGGVELDFLCFSSNPRSTGQPVRPRPRRGGAPRARASPERPKRPAP